MQAASFGMGRVGKRTFTGVVWVPEGLVAVLATEGRCRRPTEAGWGERRSKSCTASARLQGQQQRRVLS